MGHFVLKHTVYSSFSIVVVVVVVARLQCWYCHSGKYEARPFPL